MCRLGEDPEKAVALGLRRDVGDMGVYIRGRVAGPCAVRSDAKEPAALAEEAEGVHREW